MSKEVARIRRETEMIKGLPSGISASPRPENYRYFDAIITGPKDSPYEGGKFKLEIFLPEGYPYKPLKAHFITPIYHPNIDRLGRICLSVLKLPPPGEDPSSYWTPALNICTSILSIQVLLGGPNLDDPLNLDAAAHWRENQAEAEQQAREWTRKFAN